MNLTDNRKKIGCYKIKEENCNGLRKTLTVQSLKSNTAHPKVSLIRSLYRSTWWRKFSSLDNNVCLFRIFYGWSTLTCEVGMVNDL